MADKNQEAVHWSDWTSQPTVRIACTQKCGFPWRTKLAEPPLHVHEIPVDGKPGERILYTFEHHLVTCPDCLALGSFQRERDARVEVLTKAGWTFSLDHPEGMPPGAKEVY